MAISLVCCRATLHALESRKKPRRKVGCSLPLLSGACRPKCVQNQRGSQTGTTGTVADCKLAEAKCVRQASDWSMHACCSKRSRPACPLPGPHVCIAQGLRYSATWTASAVACIADGCQSTFQSCCLVNCRARRLCFLHNRAVLSSATGSCVVDTYLEYLSIDVCLIIC